MWPSKVELVHGPSKIMTTFKGYIQLGMNLANLPSEKHP